MKWWLGLWMLCAAVTGHAREWLFDVSLDGHHIGEHRYVLSEDGESRQLISEAHFNVRFLFFNAYRYEHRAQERWHGECLKQLNARTNDNGKRTVVDFDSPAEQCVQSFAYWNPSILQAHRLLNPQTGKLVDVEVIPMGSEVIAGRQTDRFRLRGDGSASLQIDLWYTPERDWVALESRTPDGRHLRYSLK